ncbi:MAG: DUF6048 family protein [Bacteroidota bacterium]
MVKRLLLSFFSLLSFTIICLAQEADSLSANPVDSLSIANMEPSLDSLESAPLSDSIAKKKRRFISPAFYLDIGKLMTIPLAIETKYEGGFELLFLEKFPVNIEIGSATLAPNGAFSNGTYESTGSYYRVGTGYIDRYDAKHDIGLTFRYAASTFDENGRIFIDSPSQTQDNFIQGIDRTNLTAKWWEVGIYSDSRLFKGSELLRYGIFLRLRILQSYDAQEEIDVYAIPGYGRSFDKTVPSANFFIKLRF